LIAQLEGGYKEPAKKLLEDIYLLRVGKIMRLASRTDSEPPKNMIAPEEAMYKEVLALLSEHRRRMVGGRKESEVVDEYVQPAEESVPEDDGKAAVRILSAMPAIVGSDMSHYGPFAEGDEVRLPKKTAHILVEKGAAEEA
jgi:DNA replication initiation complex subunit (GINS family)